LPAVEVNRVQNQQVLINLLRNAQEALQGRRDARIELRSELLSGCLKVSVLDNGPGFSEGAETLGDMRFKSEKPDGMGIGLGICRSLVEGHGGKLAIDGKGGLGGGACVSFTLPLSFSQEDGES
jgi:two-component system sensor kinase FixL